MKWPSEMDYPRRTLPEMYWPSERWNDPQFGPRKLRPANRTKPQPVAAQSAAEPTAEAAFFDAAPAPQQSTARGRKKKRKNKSTPQPAPHLAQQQQNLESRMATVALAQAMRDKQARAPTPSPAPRHAPKPQVVSKPAPPRPAGDGLPDVETLAGWVDEVGLAGAVSRLRSQTGWDFQKAARYLAQKVSGARR